MKKIAFVGLMLLAGIAQAKPLDLRGEDWTLIEATPSHRYYAAPESVIREGRNDANILTREIKYDANQNIVNDEVTVEYYKCPIDARAILAMGELERGIATLGPDPWMDPKKATFFIIDKFGAYGMVENLACKKAH